jgi:hypothetical protein
VVKLVGVVAIYGSRAVLHLTRNHEDSTLLEKILAIEKMILLD